MGFQTLAERLTKKAGEPGYIPPVLAGPMLRKVDPTSVTVWLALRTSCTVTLTVTKIDGSPVKSGQGKTVAIGTQLHLVAVTARLLDGEKAMVEGAVYQYDLSFDFDGSVMDLATATANAPLAYPPYKLPTFCLPPQNPNLLRLMCGSCRKASGDGDDCLALLDSLLAQAALSSTPLVRPHQLLLMGDQIYADDVAESLLTMLSDADKTLLGWEETLTTGTTTKQRPAYTRWQLLDDADFSSEDLRNHLMSLGEYLSMYLFVWSDVLWPKAGDPLPAYAEIRLNVLSAQASFSTEEFATVTTHLENAQAAIDGATANLASLRSALPKVRTALANIPTYMICDDHEVTDDWNMLLDWNVKPFFSRNLYGNSLGVRIVQNGVLAYALCQHWGNVPEQFDGSAASIDGAKLLTLLDKHVSADYDTNSAAIRSILAVHTSAEVASHAGGAGFYHDPRSLVYNYTVEGPGHQILFTDTRTWRAFPHGGRSHADLLPIDQFKSQIHDTPPLRTPAPANVDRVLIVVLTTNAPATEALRAFTRHDLLANLHVRSPDVYESWEIGTVPYERLLKALSDKLPADAHGKLTGQVILLSGDVHHSFATRLVYDATSRFEDDPNQPKQALAVFAQLVASSFKKQTDDTVEIHKKGYNFDPTHILTPDYVKEGYVGWNVAATSTAIAVASGVPQGSSVGIAGNTQQDGQSVGISVDHDTPVLTVTKELPESFTTFQLKKKPDYRYRLEYLPQTTTAQKTSNFNPVSIPPQDGKTKASRDAAIKGYKTAMDHLVSYHGDGAGGGQIVGVNNLCEVGFQWGAGNEKYVTHKVRWFWPVKTDPDHPLVLEASYKIKLDPAAFPDLTPAVHP